MQTVRACAICLMSGLTGTILLVGAVVGVAAIAVITMATGLLLKRRRRHYKPTSFIGKQLQQLEVVLTS